MNHRLRWILGAGLVLMLVIGLGLLYLLTQATTNQALYEDTYTRLFTVNLSVAGVLFALIVWVSYRLWVHRQQGRFGSRLMVKLAAIFALVGLVPGVLIYVVSYQFVSRSIETWFDVKVEGALEAGLSLGHVTLDIIMLYIWTKYENNPSGTAGRGTHSFGFGTIVFGFILGVFSTIAYLKANGQLPDVPGKSITTATLGNPKDYVDVSGDTLQRNSKPLPNGWRVALTQDEKTGTVIDDLVTMKAGSAWLYFDPDPTVHPSEKAKGKVKIR